MDPDFSIVCCSCVGEGFLSYSNFWLQVVAEFQLIFVQCILLFPRMDQMVHRGCVSTKPL